MTNPFVQCVWLHKEVMHFLLLVTCLAVFPCLASSPKGRGVEMFHCVSPDLYDTDTMFVLSVYLSFDSVRNTRREIHRIEE